VIKMTNRLGAGYSFDMIRARTLFGKRPGRVKAEAAAARRASMIECFSCKALFEPFLLNVKHLKPVKDLAPGERVQGVSMCATCATDSTRGVVHSWFDFHVEIRIAEGGHGFIRFDVGVAHRHRDAGVP
jgi:hypothetical protein